MGAKRGEYRTRTEAAVKGALLRLLARKPLADIGVSELAREAGVSRSTFYEHFHTPDDVYDLLVADAMTDMSPLVSQVTCSDNFRPQGKPFCAFVREAGDYSPVVGEARFVDALFCQPDASEGHDLFGLLVDAGYTHEQARAVCSFQMAGCFNAARRSQVSAEEWRQIRSAIDRFILGGIAACLAAKKS